MSHANCDEDFASLHSVCIGFVLAFISLGDFSLGVPILSLA